MPQVLAFLFGSALPIYFLNKPLHTNFYFLNNPYGNVITSTFTAWFGEKFYILGFLPAIALVRPLGSSREEALSRSATRPLPVRFPAGRVFFFQFASFWRFAVFFHQCSGNVKILLQRA